MMTNFLTLLVQGPLVFFFTFINSYEVHVLSKPWLKLNHLENVPFSSVLSKSHNMFLKVFILTLSDHIEHNSLTG